MARLNEPPVPVETMESLKRKFMRQNRDIARANSAQSLRIRNLENETSRLLADNLGLREQVLRLQLELDDGKARRIADSTSIIKAQLEVKMLEIGALINNLNQAPTPEKSSPKTGKIMRGILDQSPDQRNSKNTWTLSEAIANQEGRLPPILENKSFPRKTLEQQEIMAIMLDGVADTTDSPDIGPPPVSQFVDEDPVKFDLPTRPRKHDSDEPSSLDPTISINLEQRKKRKDSIGGSESRRASKAEPVQTIKETTGALKAGAKRKMSVREDEEIEEPTKNTEESSGDFKFTRGAGEDRNRNKPSALTEKPASKPTKELPTTKGTSREKVSGMPVIPARKVLAPKSVNNSPRKGSKTTIYEDVKVAKSDLIKNKSLKERSQEKKPGVLPIPEPTVEITLGESEPETPAGFELFSPFESQPSTARAESRDTPPPPDLGSGPDVHRPSRRARAAVSYAEPSLRDKMRRPTKELVDAVAGRNSIKLEDGTSHDLRTDLQCSNIKTELESDDEWKAMAAPSAITVENSPLGNKIPIANSLPNTITTHRKRRESLLSQAEMEVSRSSSGNAIVALLASNRRARAEAIEKTLENNNIPSKETVVDIYEFRGSPLEENSTKVNKVQKPTSKFARRHTTISRDTFVDDSEPSDIEGMKKAEKPRRRQSTNVPRSSSSASIGSTNQNKEEKALRKATSTTSIVDAGAGGSRGDRIAARRRSMML